MLKQGARRVRRIVAAQHRYKHLKGSSRRRSMKVQWYRVKQTYQKPHGGFLAIGPRYPGVLSEDRLTVLFTHPGDARWTEVVPVEYLEEAPDPPRVRRRGK